MIPPLCCKYNCRFEYMEVLLKNHHNQMGNSIVEALCVGRPGHEIVRDQDGWYVRGAVYWWMCDTHLMQLRLILLFEELKHLGSDLPALRE